MPWGGDGEVAVVVALDLETTGVAIVVVSVEDRLGPGAEDIAAVDPGIATAGLIAAGNGSKHAGSADPSLGGVLGVSGGEAVVSAGIHIKTAGFLTDDAGVGGNHPVAGGFIGVETPHTHSG